MYGVDAAALLVQLHVLSILSDFCLRLLFVSHCLILRESVCKFQDVSVAQLQILITDSLLLRHLWGAIYENVIETFRKLTDLKT